MIPDQKCLSETVLMRVATQLTLTVPETKIAEFANSLDLDEMAHNEPPHQDLHCLPSSLRILNMI